MKKIVFCLSFLCGLGQAFGQNPVKMDKLTVCIPSFREEFLTLAVAVADAQGFFKKNNVEVTFKTILNPNDTGVEGAHKRTETGAIDLQSLSDMSVLQAFSDKASGCQIGSTVIDVLLASDKKLNHVVPLLVSMYGDGYDTALVARKTANIKKTADLKGKKVRTGHVLTDIAMSNYLAKNGMKLADLQLNRTSPWMIEQGLKSGTIDAAIAYVPVMPVLMANSDYNVVATDMVKNHVLPKVPHSLLIADKKTAETQKDAMKRFMKAVDEANEFINSNPSEAIYAFKELMAVYAKSAPRRAATMKWDVTPVMAEKAAPFVGKQTLVRPQDKVMINGKATPLVEIVADYHGMLTKHKYTVSQLDRGFFQYSLGL